MVDIVNNLGELNHHGQRTVWGQWMVETTGNFMSTRGRKWWSGSEGSHVGWVKEGATLVLDADGIPEL